MKKINEKKEKKNILLIPTSINKSIIFSSNVGVDYIDVSFPEGHVHLGYTISKYGIFQKGNIVSIVRQKS